MWREVQGATVGLDSYLHTDAPLRDPTTTASAFAPQRRDLCSESPSGRAASRTTPPRSWLRAAVGPPASRSAAAKPIGCAVVHYPARRRGTTHVTSGRSIPDFVAEKALTVGGGRPLTLLLTVASMAPLPGAAAASSAPKWPAGRRANNRKYVDFRKVSCHGFRRCGTGRPPMPRSPPSSHTKVTADGGVYVPAPRSS